MKEIVDRLTENRQVELAKSILESKGYKVKKLRESSSTSDIYQLLVNKLGASSMSTVSANEYNGNEDYDSIIQNFKKNIAFDNNEMRSLEDCIEFLEKSISYLEKIGFAVNKKSDIPKQEDSDSYRSSIRYILSRGEESIEVTSSISKRDYSQVFIVYTTIHVYSEDVYNIILDKEERDRGKDKEKSDRNYNKRAAKGTFSEILFKYKSSGMLLREVIDIDKENGDYDEDSPLAQVASKLGGTLDNIYMFTPESGGNSEKAYRWIIDSAERSDNKVLSSFHTSSHEPWNLCTSKVTGDYIEHASFGYYEVYIKIE